MRALRSILAATTAFVGVHSASAQEVAPEGAATAASPEAGEILVTATRRSEALSRVPMAITALSQQQIQASGVTEARNLPQIAPSLFISTSTSESSGAQVRLRGVGTSSNNAGFEGSVGIFSDGVYVNRPGEALSDLMDLARIEVVRGPQGTLYGKNTTTGVINLITNAPTFTWEGHAALTYGNYNAMGAEAVVSGPVSDKVAFRLSGIVNVRDGYIRDVALNRDLNDRNRYQVRGQILIQPTDAVSLRIIGEMSQKDEACCAAPYVITGSGSANIVALGGTVLNPADPANRYRIALNGPMRSFAKSRALTAILNWDLGPAAAKLTYGHRYFRASDSYDSDNSNLDIVNVNDQRLEDRRDTLELQLTGRYGPADLLLGVFAYDNSIAASQSSVFGADAGRFYNRLSGGVAPASYYPAGGGDTLQTFAQTGRGLSIFTHNVVEMLPGLKATLGLRWLTEEKQGSGTLYTDGVADRFGMPLPARCVAPVPTNARAFCPANPIGGRFTDSHWTYGLGLSYEPAPGTLLFANYGTGYKAGGINAAKDARGPTTIDPANVSGVFAPETVRSWEAGVKLRPFGSLLRLNVTAFLMDFDNFQFQTRNQTTLSTQVQTAASVKSKGVELELDVTPLPGLSLGGNASYVMARYSANTADATLAGQRLGNSPEWTFQPRITYTAPVSDHWTGTLNLNARRVSSFNANVTLLPGNFQPAFTLVNGTFTLAHDNGLSVALFGRNLFNTYYPSLRTQAPLQANTFIAFAAEPRTYGVTLRKEF